MNNQNKKQDKNQVKSLADKGHERDLKGIKKLMEKRAEQRVFSFYFLVNAKIPTALIYGRQLLFTSQKIWKEFQDQLKDLFEELFFFRTRKAKEQTQYLLDCSLLCKIFLAARKKEDVVEILQKIEFPQTEIIDKSSVTDKQSQLEYNELRQIHSRSCALFLTFIELTKNEKLNDYTSKLYEQYIVYVQKYYSPYQYATAKFKYASYLYQIHDFQKASKEYNDCIETRKKNSLNEGYVDVLINSAICLKQLGKLKEAITRTNTGIQIYKDSKQKKESLLNDYFLFLAKLYMQNGEFDKAYENYLIVYYERISLEKHNPRRVQAELNVLFLFETLKKIQNKAEGIVNLKDKKQIQLKRKEAIKISNLMKQTVLKRDQFTKYRYFQSSKTAHLRLQITQLFFEQLTSEQVQELDALVIKLGKYPFAKGKNQLFKTTFWADRKTREMLIEVNQQLRI